MEYLIRLAQMHEDFRLAEIRSLASFFGIGIDVVSYSTDSPFLVICITSYPTSSFCSENPAAETLISRSVLSLGVYELWGATSGDNSTYAGLHDDVRTRTNQNIWKQYRASSFKFSIDSYNRKRSSTEQTDIINCFRYLGFEGPIRMKDADFEFTVFEEWNLKQSPHHQPKSASKSKPVPLDSPPTNFESDESSPTTTLVSRRPTRLAFGRLLARSPRSALVQKHDLKSRPYISTTSMDATLALVTANLAHAGPSKIIYDPFVGTGGFLVAAAEFGSYVWGSDIDGRSFRGKDGRGRSSGCDGGIGKNFAAYGLNEWYGDCFISDIVNTPLRLTSHGKLDGSEDGWIDVIISDPPYGVREGLQVLGTRRPKPDQLPHMIDGVLAHTVPGYIAPKKPYSVQRMLDDILGFAAATLVVTGRLAFWMPSANEDDGVLEIPQHPRLELVECCVQRFNKWSRRLLVYQKRAKSKASELETSRNGIRGSGEAGNGTSASDLNPFRRKYFQGFQT
jgi:tRNA (guanine10-N2)-methyltransferase